MIFQDRRDSGRQLAELLEIYRDRGDCIVIGLPRGGVVTAYEVSKELNLPLDVICPMKIGAPTNPEFAVGAITDTGEGILNERSIRSLGISEGYIKNSIESLKLEAQNRLKKFRQGRNALDVSGKIVIVVDDGMATGLTMKAAIKSLRKSRAVKIIVAVPVAPPDTIPQISSLADEVICIETPYSFYAVGQFYSRFDQTSTEEVVELLKERSTVCK